MKRMILFLVPLLIGQCFAAKLVAAFTIAPISQNGAAGQDPRVEGSKVVWLGSGGHIYRWDGTNIDKITYEGSNSTPSISGPNIVWARNYDIYRWDGVNTTKLSTNEDVDWDPDISGSNVVWTTRFGSAFYIWLQDISTNMGKNISYNRTVSAESPAIDGLNIVWSGYVENSGWHTYFLDLSAAAPVELNLSSGISTGNGNPDVSGSNVVWRGSDGNDWEIYFWDGNTTTQITDNDYNDDNPAVFGTNVVWEGWVDSDPEIFWWNGTDIVQITDNEYYDRTPDISGSHLVWRGNGVIFHTYVPVPGAVWLLGSGLIALVGLRRKLKK